MPRKVPRTFDNRSWLRSICTKYAVVFISVACATLFIALCILVLTVIQPINAEADIDTSAVSEISSEDA